MSPGAVLTCTLRVAGHGGSWGPQSVPDGPDRGCVGLSRLEVGHGHAPVPPAGGSVPGDLLPAHLQLKGLIAALWAGPGQGDPIATRDAGAGDDGDGVRVWEAETRGLGRSQPRWCSLPPLLHRQGCQFCDRDKEPILPFPKPKYLFTLTF